MSESVRENKTWRLAHVRMRFSWILWFWALTCFSCESYVSYESYGSESYGSRACFLWVLCSVCSYALMILVVGPYAFTMFQVLCISTFGSQFPLAHAPACCLIVCRRTSFAASSFCSRSPMPSGRSGEMKAWVRRIQVSIWAFLYVRVYVLSSLCS